MKQFLATLLRNLIGCFQGWIIVWHLVAILLTVILVLSGFDWRYYLATRDSALRAWVAILYAFYVGIGVSMTIHWFSDFAAGAIIGSVIGAVVGKCFCSKVNIQQKVTKETKDSAL